MKKGLQILFIGFCMLAYNSCGWLTPEPRIIDATTNISISLLIDLSGILNPDSVSGIVNIQEDNPQVVFYGTLLDVDDAAPVAGARIRIEGTDTPGQTVYTKSNGEWEAVLPVVPERNNEEITIFVIEVQSDKLTKVPLADFCKNDTLVYDLLGVTAPNEYFVAGAYKHNVAWGNLYRRIECPIYVKLKQ